MSESLDDYLTVPEAAAYLRISPRKIYDLVSRSQLPHLRAGARLLFERSALAQWVRGNGLEYGMASPPLVLAGSHDALMDWAVRASRSALASLCRGSRDGLERVRRREACAALLHLPEPDVAQPEGGRFNLDAVGRSMAGQDVVLINWCWRQQGLMVAPDNPFDIRTLDDLLAGTGRNRLRIGRRSAGAGSRELFDQLIGDLGATQSAQPDIDLAVDDLESENDAALAVRLGQVDAVFGAQSAAESLGLGFVPVIRERVDLLVCHEATSSRRCKRCSHSAEQNRSLPMPRSLAATISPSMARCFGTQGEAECLRRRTHSMLVTGGCKSGSGASSL